MQTYSNHLSTDDCQHRVLNGLLSFHQWFPKNNLHFLLNTTPLNGNFPNTHTADGKNIIVRWETWYGKNSGSHACLLPLGRKGSFEKQPV